MRGQRQYLPFRAVNRRDAPGYDPGLQRHHLLPRQVLARPCFAGMLKAMDGVRPCFNDFRANGLLLPCNEQAALRFGMPLHRGPHRHYSALVIERVGRIEAGWSRLRPRDPERAAEQVQMRLSLLQRALRRSLLDSSRRRLMLNRRDPLGAGIDFSELDAMADMLWGATNPLPGQRIPARARSSSLAD